MKIKEWCSHVTFKDLLLWGFMALFTFMIGTTLFYMFYPYEPIRVDKIVVFKSEVQRGDTLCFQFIGEKYMNVPVHATIELVNGERIAAMSYTSNNPTGTLFKKRQFIIPYHTMPGQYRIKWTGVYEVNPIRSITYEKYSDWITIK